MRSLRVSIPGLRKDRKPRSVVDEVASEGGPIGGVQRSKGKTRQDIPLFVRNLGNLGEPRLLGCAESLNPPTRTNDFAEPQLSRGTNFPGPRCE
jgi:hypothetical protein